MINDKYKKLQNMIEKYRYIKLVNNVLHVCFRYKTLPNSTQHRFTDMKK